MTMNLKDQNLRFALLKAIADAINDELAAERTGHTLELVDRYDESGVKSFDVRLPSGAKVAAITLSIPKPSMAVTDEAALVEWCRRNMPSAVTEHHVPAVPEQVIPAQPARTEYEVDQAMVSALLKGARPVDAAGGLVVDEGGEVIDGVTYTPAGRPKSFSVRYESDGREALALAYRAGELSHLVAGSALPALPPEAEVIPMPAAPRTVLGVVADTDWPDGDEPVPFILNEDLEEIVYSWSPGDGMGTPLDVEPLVWGGDHG